MIFILRYPFLVVEKEVSVAYTSWVPIADKGIFFTDIQKHHFLRNLDCSGTKMFCLQGRKTFHGNSWNAEVKMQDEDIEKDFSFKQGALWCCIEVFLLTPFFQTKLYFG